MPSWNELLPDVERLTPEQKGPWIDAQISSYISKIAALRGGRHVISYMSGFFQKANVPMPFVSIFPEDINGFMAVMKGMDWSRKLTLILHTPGGVTNATETIVEYLLQKFDDIEIIIPVLAMSAGTMISLAANNIVMGRQSQLGPIDPQFLIGSRQFSARSINDQFELAKKAITGGNGDVATHAALWAPMLQSLGPGLLVEAKEALNYGEEMVSRWLAARAFSAHKDPEAEAKKVAAYFNRSKDHHSHGQRIGRDEVHSQGLQVENLEDTPELQDSVLTLYHLNTLIFELSPTTKVIAADNGAKWVKNFQPA